MDVLIVGGHGKIALRLERLLVGAGHTARGVIRNPGHAADLEAAGATPIVFDLEHDEGLAGHLSGADAAVFAAGAGPGSGPERKLTVDQGGATKLIDACREAGVARYVIISSINADRRERWSEEMRPYFEAKAAADEAVRESGLQYTIVRPGYLTNDPGTGRIEAAESLEHPGKISRDDVAATLLAVLEAPATIGVSFDLIGGDVPAPARGVFAPIPRTWPPEALGTLSGGTPITRRSSTTACLTLAGRGATPRGASCAQRTMLPCWRSPMRRIPPPSTRR